MLTFIAATSARDGTGWAGDGGVGLLTSCVSNPTPGPAKASMKRATMPLPCLALGCGRDGVDVSATGAGELAGGAAGGGGGARRGGRRAAGVPRVGGGGRRGGGWHGGRWAARGRGGARAGQPGRSRP